VAPFILAAAWRLNALRVTIGVSINGRRDDGAANRRENLDVAIGAANRDEIAVCISDANQFVRVNGVVCERLL